MSLTANVWIDSDRAVNKNCYISSSSSARSTSTVAYGSVVLGSAINDVQTAGTSALSSQAA
jgi:hypothetical protein